MKSIVFFGTHKFAASILQALIDDPDISVALVITQPDRLVGRHQTQEPPPVKRLAQRYNIDLLQPASLKKQTLSLTTYDLGVVAQYGILIPKQIIEAPSHGMLNVHTSLLPKYRGASPIQSALAAGESKTGVTIMQMDEGLDTGSIVLQKNLSIDPDDTFPTLEKKMAKIAAQTLREAIDGYLSGQLIATAQDHTQASTCRQLHRDDGRVHWQQMTAEEVYNRHRGLTPMARYLDHLAREAA